MKDHMKKKVKKMKIKIIQNKNDNANLKTVFKKYHITIIKAVKTKPKPVHTPGKKNKNINNKKISRVQRSGGTDLMDQGKVKHQFQYGDCNVQDCGQNVRL